MTHVPDSSDRSAHPPENGRYGVRASRLAAKELRETLRDRRTIVTLLLMPILVYPILSLIFQGFVASGLNPQRSQQYSFVFDSAAQFDLFIGHLLVGQQLLDEEQNPVPGTAGETKPRSVGVDELERNRWEVRDSPADPSLEELIASGEGDVGIEVTPSGMRSHLPQLEGGIICRFYYRPESPHSSAALAYLQQRIDAINAADFRQRLRDLGGDERSAVIEDDIPVESTVQQAVSVAALVPMILILMTITGAVYPAIDLTAGERERGTLESLIAAPIPRMKILLGKFSAVVVVALLTAVLNIAGMSVTIWVFQLDEFLFGEQGLTIAAIAQVFCLLALFACFFSSLLLAITSFARSFKEAQAYLIPLMLVALAPGLLSLKPDLTLDGPLSVAPLINIVLLARDVLQGTAHPGTAVIAVASTLIYSALALTFAARIFGTDAVLYGSSEGWGELFRRPRYHSPAASPSLAMLCVALLFPASFIWQGIVSRTAGQGIYLQMVTAASGIIVVFVVIPLAFVILRRLQPASSLALQPHGAIAFFGAVLLGFGLGPMLIQAIASSEWLLELMFPGSEEAKQALVAQFQDQIARWRQAPLVLVLFALAIVPAVCEELFFRGFLFRALLGALSPAKTILATAAIFGAFHLVTGGSLGISRLVPTTIMGVVLGWVCFKTSSVLPGMVLHAIHNGLYISMGYFHQELVATGWLSSTAQNVPLYVLLVALVLAATGFGLLNRLKPLTQVVAAGAA